MTQPRGDEFAPMIMGSFKDAQVLLNRAVTEIRKEWNNLVERIHSLLRRVQHELNTDSIWATISEWWTDKIKNAIEKVHEILQEIRRKIDKILTAVEDTVQQSLPVASLFDVGLNWATKVNTPLSDLGPDMTGSGQIDSWRGPTKITYEKRVQDQIGAVDATVDKVKSVSAWLADVAAANTTYMVGLADRAAEVIGALVAVVIDGTETASGAVTQIVITLQHCSELIGACVAQSLQYLAGLADRVAEVMKQITTVAGEHGDHTGLPGGAWPRAVNA
jgi:uncharacterized protein YukE